MPGDAAIRQPGFQARGRPQQGHRRASCRPDFVRLSRKLALLDAVNRAETALACSDVVRWSDLPESGHFREQKAFFHALILRNLCRSYITS